MPVGLFALGFVHAAFAGDTLCSVMNADRPAVQLCSPYASVNRIPSLANGRC